MDGHRKKRRSSSERRREMELKPPKPPPRRTSRSLNVPPLTPHPSGADRTTARAQSRRQPVSGRKGSNEGLSRRLAHAGGGHSGYKDSKNSRTALLLFLLFIAALVLLVLYFLGILFGKNECTNFDLPPEYRAIVCARLKLGKQCTFNVESCETECPLGLETDDFACIISCDCATKGLFESDVSYDQNNLQSLLSAYMTIEDHDIQLFSGSATSLLNIWNKIKIGTSIRVPYVLSSDLDPEVLNAVNSAIDILSNDTCVELVLRTYEQDYLLFKNGAGCSSSMSRVGGEQHIILAKACNTVGAVLHEILHALGFWHEHSRPDRDDHVMIMWENIKKSKQHNFNTRSIDAVFDFGSPYDKSSVMHGSGYSFSADFSSPTMIDLNTDDPVLVQRKRLSVEDAAEINSLYECPPSYNETISNPHWGAWSPEGQCSMTCGSGVAYKLRECLSSKQQIIRRRYCGTQYYEQQSCDRGPCEQGAWGPWSPCDHTCGIGTKKRTSCCGTNTTTEVEHCNLQDCEYPAEAFWADWQEWGECLRSCGNGMRRRYRACFDVYESTIENLRCPQAGTAHLSIDICAAEPCPDSEKNVGYWGVWSDWGECSRTCGVGTERRMRECFTLNGTYSKYCIGDNAEIRPCNKTACVRIALSLWTPWGPWSDCSATCDGGTRSRVRICESEVPLTLETDCGISLELLDEEKRIETCRNEPCEPESAQWSEWGSWGQCSKPCKGTQWRLRTCIGGSLGDPACEWDGVYETQDCNEGPCDYGRRSDDSTGSHWGAWFQWTPCSLSCGTGQKTRYRLCERDNLFQEDCELPENRKAGSMMQDAECTLMPCVGPDDDWREWESWRCSSKMCRRRRECIEGRRCSGSPIESRPCKPAECMKPRRHRFRKLKEGIFASEKLSNFFGGRDSTVTSAPTRPLCDKESRAFLGDFDGDGKEDSLCLDFSGRIKVTYSEKVVEFATATWKESGFCSNDISMVYVDDFNKDGTDELMCHEKDTGIYNVIFSRKVSSKDA